MSDTLQPINFNVNKFKKRRGNLASDLRQIISQRVGLTFPAIARLTQGWTEDMLKDAVLETDKMGAKGFWYYRKLTIL